jgi:hypothetical protein
VGGFTTTLSPIDQLSRLKNPTSSELNYSTDQTSLMDIYRIFHPCVAEYTFFSVSHGTFSNTDHSLGHEESLNKYKF